MTFRGGSQSGWIRAILYNPSGVEVARSTGPNGTGGGAGFPITFAAVPAPTAAGSYTFTAAWFGNMYDSGNATNANHGEERVSTNTFTVSAPAGPSITTASPLTAGTVGTPYNQTFTASGGTQPYSWSVTAGSPPAGLTLSTAGVLSGTPTAAGTSNFTVTVSGGGTGSQAFSLTINPAGGGDTVPPAVSSTTPAGNAAGVPVNTTVTATFNEPLNPATVTAASFTLSGGVSGTVSLNPARTIATFTPSASLANNTSYTATLTTAITDDAGNALAANHVWTFTTAAAADTAPPTVGSTTPDNNATAVAVGTPITATFSEAVNPTSVTATSFLLMRGVDNVAGTVSASGATATFTPSAPLADNTTYTAILTTAITDVAGNALATNHVWTFSTGAAVTPPVVELTSGGGGGCAISPSPGGSGGILGTYGILFLVALWPALRRRARRRKQ